jgi:hypothetical protein
VVGRHQCRWEFAVTCETCGLVGHASSFEELQAMRARHEGQSCDSQSHAPLEDFVFQHVTDTHSLTLANVRQVNARMLQGK